MAAPHLIPSSISRRVALAVFLVITLVLIAVAWFIVAKGDWEEIFAGARLRAIAICLIVGAFVMMFAALIAYLYRRWDAGIAERSREAERVKLSALYEAQSSLAAIVKSSDDAIIGKDLNGMITSWNLGAEKMFGYTAAEIVGTSILRLIPDGRQQEEQGILEKIRSGGSVEHFETLRQAKDGRLLDVSHRAVANLVGRDQMGADGQSSLSR